MKFTQRIQKGLAVAARAHSEQKRKTDGLPYIVHPVGVAWILARHTEDENVLIAGLLHDVLEDTKDYTVDHMRQDFGDDVTRLVEALSEKKSAHGTEASTWQGRKEAYLSVLSSAEDNALLISAADKIHNIRSMRGAYLEHGEQLWSFFHAPMDAQLWFFGAVLELIQQRLGSHPLIEEYHEELSTLRKLLTASTSA